jgi:hypothetical protein
MALANVGGSNEHPRKLRRDPLLFGGMGPVWRAFFIAVAIRGPACCVLCYRPPALANGELG